MTPQTSNYQTFAEIARETAIGRHSESWRVYSDDILSSLLHDFWCGRFIDGKGKSCTFDLSHRQGGTYQSITREVVWRTMGDSRPRKLQDVREENPTLWAVLATAKIEEYGSGVRPTFENLALSEADARAWMEQYDNSAGSSTNHQTEKRGLKPQYDWEEFLRAVVEIADKDGLPDTQTELEKLMLEWCRDNWGAEPSVSTIRERVKRLYPRPYIEG